MRPFAPSISRFLLAGGAAILPLLAGCASHPPQTLADKPLLLPATQPLNPSAEYTYAQIGPAPSLAPASQPAGEAPLEALQLYARARAAIIDNHPLQAQFLLQQAIKIDPDSFELRRSLATTLLGSAGPTPLALQALQEALALEPNHFGLQLELGRDLLLKGQYPQSLWHLRAAAETAMYADDDTGAIVTDFFLARALQENGYLRAALDRYQQVFTRLAQPLSPDAQSEVADLAGHPEIVYAQIGDIQLRRGQWAAARAAFDNAAAHDPENFDLRTRAIRAALMTGDVPAARESVAKLVLDFHCSAESLDFLRQFYHVQGNDDQAIAALAALQSSHPQDRALLLALVDAQIAFGRTADARALLTSALAPPIDPALLQRLWKIAQFQHDPAEAARLLVDVSTRDPQVIPLLDDQVSQLASPASPAPLKVDALQSLHVSPDQDGARWYWVWRLASARQRNLLADAALQNARGGRPFFAPAWIASLRQCWEHDDWSTKKKIEQSQHLIDTLKSQNAVALSQELSGIAAMEQQHTDAACAAFDAALTAGGDPAQLLYEKAEALIEADRWPAAQALLKQALRDNPRLPEAYETLFAVSAHLGDLQQVTLTIQNWLAALPDSVQAQVLNARYVVGLGQPDQGEAALLKLLADHPDDPLIMRALLALHGDGNFGQKLVPALQDLLKTHPENHPALEALTAIYTQQHNAPAVQKLLDDARDAAATDPWNLYNVALLYDAVNPQQHQAVLEQVVKLDPTFAPASNDLGYSWADQGQNLDRAEQLVRVAVQAEPDNQSYLDSMGWVEYKQGRFDAAKDYLMQAVGAADAPDPVVLDHLGDTLWRLKLTPDATAVWQRSLKRITDRGANSDDARQLQQRLQHKLDQAARGQAVDVAPFASQQASPATQVAPTPQVGTGPQSNQP